MPSFLWQNFLIDSKAKTKIRDLVLAYKEKNDLKYCVEIGPGKGAITKLIQPIFADDFWAIEKDETFQDILEELINPEHIIRSDVLLLEKRTLPPIALNKTLLYGSLPYYITSPIISKFLLDPQFGIPVGIFIVQKEFAEKVATEAKKKSYLRWLLNYSHTVQYHKTISAKGFSPAPKVDSAIISVSKTSAQDINYEHMLVVLDMISGFKRKTLGKIIKMLEDNKKISSGSKQADVDPKLKVIFPKRLEEISREEMNILTQYIYSSILDTKLWTPKK